MSTRFDFDGWDTLLDSMKAGAVGAHRVRTPVRRHTASDVTGPSPRLRVAVTEADRILAPGQWVRARDIRRIAAAHQVAERTLLQALHDLAESDSGRWLCRPNRGTPPTAPDGT